MTMKAKKKLILIGAGGHCNSCIDVIEQENKYRIVGLIDKKKKFKSKYKVIGTDKDLKRVKKNCDNILVSIGQIKNLFVREKIFKLGKKFGINKVDTAIAYGKSERNIGANKERTLLRYKEFTSKETILSLLALTPIILVFYARASLNSFVPISGFSLTPFAGSFIVLFCGTAFLSIIFGATFAIRLLGKK